MSGDDYLYNTISDYADDVERLSEDIRDLKQNIRYLIGLIEEHIKNGHENINPSWVINELEIILMQVEYERE